MCLCLLLMLSRLEVTAFDKVFLRMPSSARVHLQRENVGGDWTPQKSSGY